MGHLAAVWNITSALGGAPRFGRGNFPLDSGRTAGRRRREARAVQRGGAAALHLSRAAAGFGRARRRGFAPERSSRAASLAPRLTPMAIDYDTVGEFYATLGANCAASSSASARRPRSAAIRGLQLSRGRDRSRAAPSRVICSKTALAAFDAIVGRAKARREACDRLALRAVRRDPRGARGAREANPAFEPAFPAARQSGAAPPAAARRARVDRERAGARDASISRTRLRADAAPDRAIRIACRGPQPEKALRVDLAHRLMRA